VRPAAWLDRDGAINEDVTPLNRFERLTVFPLSIDAVRLLDRDLGRLDPRRQRPHPRM